ncbi:LOW QUALITY PROTEIN: hypothetical protein ACHAW5_002539 [Stephanodiscus triporus]|uniref:Uncharacterized protein n=1 Tax=Stephanodiscus triporus TaxID=2934178 RepID=A0ABD3Q919_9STRA
MPSLGEGDDLRLRVAGTSADSRRTSIVSFGTGGRSSNRVLGSMSGNGMTIDVVIDTYDDWKEERDGRIERDRMRQVRGAEMSRKVVLGEGRLGL